MIYCDELAIKYYLEQTHEYDFSLKKRIFSSTSPFLTIKRYLLYDVLAVALCCLLLTVLDEDSLFIYASILIVCFCLMAADFYKMLLPDSLLAILFSVGLYAGINSVFIPLEDAVFNVIVVFYGLYAFIKTYEFVRKREVMGRGDIKLIPLCFLFVPLQSFVPFVVIACILFLLGVFISKKSKANMDSPFPFGPALCASLILHVFYGQEIIMLL